MCGPHIFNNNVLLLTEYKSKSIAFLQIAKSTYSKVSKSNLEKNSEKNGWNFDDFVKNCKE